jgi:ArsR family transcriptional regulator, arsenate/arsenite/antimonite-responsive transcriptional repressor / arsenate reductase (thioredoxin)
MTVEPNLDRRARLHGALADPARLQVVDRLMVSDASPAELRSLLGIPSNLLTHHLHVLEREGLLTRRRSEGDRRRTYLQLVPEVLEHLLPHSARPAGRVVFVCTANTARSQLAAALWRRASAVPATSAGTHPADRIAPGALATAKRHRLPLRQVAPRCLDDVVTEGDYLVTVCDNAHEELQRRYGERRDAVHWSVPDPVPVGSDAAFDAVYGDLAARVHHLADRLVPA